MAKPFVKRDAFLPFSRPTIRQVEIDEVVDTLRSGWITTGPKTERFEKDFAAYVGAPEALAVSSATGGLNKVLLFIAIVFGTINIVGGFLVTDRMLGMFKGRKKAVGRGQSAEEEGQA